MILNKNSFYSLIDIIDASIYWKNKKGVYLGCNKYMLKMAGLNNINEIIGKTDYDMPWKNYANKINEIDKLVLINGIYYGEENTTIKNNINKIFLTTKTQLLDNKNKIVGIIGASIDITDRKEKELLKIEIEKQKVIIEEKKKFKTLIDQMSQLINSFKLTNLNDKIGNQIKITEKDKNIELTRREKQILYYISLNKSPKDIATILTVLENKQLSSATINSIINKKLYAKFNVHNLGQLIEKATTLQLLPSIL